MIAIKQHEGAILTDRQRTAQRIAPVAWAALIALGLVWELAVAPLASGSWRLALKVVPLVVLLPAVFHGRVYGMQVALLVVLIYVFEGSVRCFEPTPVRELALAELVLAIIF